MPSQIFIYVIAIIIFSFLLLYGYNAIRDFTKKAEDVSYLKFTNDLEHAVKQGSGFGDVTRKEFSIPGYEKICFVDLSGYVSLAEKEVSCLCNRGSCSPNPDFNPVMCDAWKDNKQNVFLDPMAKTPIKLWNVTVDGADSDTEEDGSECASNKCFYLCLPIVNGKLTIKLNGLGDRVMVSEWD